MTVAPSPLPHYHNSVKTTAGLRQNKGLTHGPKFIKSIHLASNVHWQNAQQCNESSINSNYKVMYEVFCHKSLHSSFSVEWCTCKFHVSLQFKLQVSLLTTYVCVMVFLYFSRINSKKRGFSPFMTPMKFPASTS